MIAIISEVGRAEPTKYQSDKGWDEKAKVEHGSKVIPLTTVIA